jgi:predicted signal transduction protein with EAL and GGDEF domain
MKNITTLNLLFISIAINIMLVFTTIYVINQTSYCLSNKIESIKKEILKIEDMTILFKKEKEKLNKENIKSLEKTDQVYTSDYIKEISNRVAIAQEKLQSNPTLARSDELYKDLMAELELDNYNFGVGHNVIEKNTDKDSLTNYNELRLKLTKLGFTEDDIDEFMLMDSK